MDHPDLQGLPERLEAIARARPMTPHARELLKQVRKRRKNGELVLKNGDFRFKNGHLIPSPPTGGHFER